MENKIDPRPFYWALMIVGLCLVIWQTLAYVGNQRTHNTQLWQRWFPITMRSPAQTIVPTGANLGGHPTSSAVQTEAGVYFLMGGKLQLAGNDKVVVQTNDRWDLYLCSQDGERCVSIHSFCAKVTLASIVRDPQGRVEGCYAPHLGSGTSNASVAAITSPPPDRAGKTGGRSKLQPAIGITHPREWGWRMGLPLPTAAS